MIEKVKVSKQARVVRLLICSRKRLVSGFTPLLPMLDATRSLPVVLGRDYLLSTMRLLLQKHRLEVVSQSSALLLGSSLESPCVLT